MPSDKTDWENLYSNDFMPWDTRRPDSHLIAVVEETPIPPCRALEVGCGTGTNAIWLAEKGFQVTAVDSSPTAIKLARLKPGAGLCTFRCADFFTCTLPAEKFGFVFDLGCLHSFDEAVDRDVFAQRVAESLTEGGVWFSILGSADGPEMGPPRRTAAEIVTAAEPYFEIISLSADVLDDPPEEEKAALGIAPDVRQHAWTLLMRKRRGKDSQG